MWVVVSITCFQLCNIEPEPQKIESVCFLKLNNALEYFESNHIIFSVLKDFLNTIFDKIRFLVNYQSGFQPANLRITGWREVGGRLESFCNFEIFTLCYHLTMTPPPPPPHFRIFLEKFNCLLSTFMKYTFQKMRLLKRNC